MTVEIIPQKLRGAVSLPAGKSMLQRYILAASLADGESVIKGFSSCEDVEAMISCAEAFGARFHVDGYSLRIEGIAGKYCEEGIPVFNCKESATVLRFLIPVSLALSGGGVFSLSGSLLKRPLKPYYNLFDKCGIEYEMKDSLLTVRGELKSGDYILPGNVSSQFFSGLLFALALCDGDSIIRSESRIESSGYIEMTRQALKCANIETTEDGNGLYVSRGNYRCISVTAPQDSSAAAFWHGANFIGNNISITNMTESDTSPDSAAVDIMNRISAGGSLEISVADCPDLAPALSVVAALNDGEFRISHAERLRYKESDRLHAISKTLEMLGADICETDDGLHIEGKRQLNGGVTVNPYHDHRIVMMLAIAASRCCKPVRIEDAECVSKSYPGFFEDYRALGGVVNVI